MWKRERVRARGARSGKACPVSPCLPPKIQPLRLSSSGCGGKANDRTYPDPCFHRCPTMSRFPAFNRTSIETELSRSSVICLRSWRGFSPAHVLLTSGRGLKIDASIYAVLWPLSRLNARAAELECFLGHCKRPSHPVQRVAWREHPVSRCSRVEVYSGLQGSAAQWCTKCWNLSAYRAFDDAAPRAVLCAHGGRSSLANNLAVRPSGRSPCRIRACHSPWRPSVAFR